MLKDAEAQVAAAREARDWLAKQVNGCIEYADASAGKDAPAHLTERRAVVKAVFRGPNGATMILGLSAENVRRLQNDEPILFDGAEVGLPTWRIAIVAGEDEARLAAYIKTKGADL